MFQCCFKLYQDADYPLRKCKYFKQQKPEFSLNTVEEFYLSKNKYILNILFSKILILTGFVKLLVKYVCGID